MEGLYEIVAIKANMNLGLSDVLKIAFPDVIPIPRPLVELPIKDLDGFWISGFTADEGCFLIRSHKSSRLTLGETVGLEFIITQHSRDKELFEFFIKYFNCGRIYTAGKTTYFIVSSFKDINAIIIPFFNKYPLQKCKNIRLYWFL